MIQNKVEQIGVGDQNNLTDIYISPEVIMKKLRRLVINKAPGIDNLVPKVLIETAEYICKPLSIIYNESLNCGIVPTDWKRANVTAVFKKGPKDSACNYRPISLTSQVCKVMKSIIKDRVVKHLNDFKLIRDSQHGFMRHKSCLTNLIKFYDTVEKMIDNGDAVDVVFLDFQKAFDKVPHQRLILKVKGFGIDGKILSWIKDWLCDRQQRVVLNGFMSDWSSVCSGVPQGSVLGPLLFVLFINDIDTCVSSKILKFADDTKLFRKVSSQADIEAIREDLTNLFRWSEDWQMLFNIEKCKVLHIGKNNGKEIFSMGGKVLESVEEEKDLGVIVNYDLKVSKQCTKVVKTAHRVLGMISRSFTYKDKVVILQLYKTLVRPHLEYCVQAWRPHLQKDIVLMERFRDAQQK